MPHRFAIPLLAAVVTACGSPEPSQPGSSDYLYLWTGSADSTQPDFLAVMDLRPDSDRYGDLVATLPVPGLGNGPHHTEHEMPVDGQLFANGFDSGETFIFDLTNPTTPRLAGQFGDAGGMAHPHSFLRLPGGNVLATFQMQHDSTGMIPGGLVELTSSGQVVRSSSANRPGTDPALRVYSAGIVPSLDRIVTTTTDMDGDFPARMVQIWRLSDLSLLHTITLPDGPAGTEAKYSAEPRVLSDGRTVLVSTFSCGLYLMDGLEGETPSARLVASFPTKVNTACAIPVVSGDYYLVTVPAWSAVVVLDISDPANPHEVNRLVLEPDDVPHWISLEPAGNRVVITGYEGLRHRVLIADFDQATGALVLDQRFREAGATEPGFRMDNKTWPHGGSAAGIPHGAVFSRP